MENRDTPAQAALRERINGHEIFQYPGSERLTYKREWKDLCNLVIQFKAFDKLIEKRFEKTFIDSKGQKQPDSVLGQDEEALWSSLGKAQGVRQNKFDGVALVEALAKAVKHFDPANGAEFMAYFDRIYATEIQKTSYKQLAATQMGAVVLNDRDAKLVKLLRRRCGEFGCDPKAISRQVYDAVAQELGTTADHLMKVMELANMTNKFVSMDNDQNDGDDDDAPSREYGDETAPDPQVTFERAAEAMRAIMQFAALDAQEYPRIFFTNDVLAPLFDAKDISPIAYYNVLHKSEDVLWNRIFAQDYIEFVFAPPPALTCLRNLMDAAQKYPLRDATIAKMKHCKPANISAHRRRYANTLAELQQKMG